MTSIPDHDDRPITELTLAADLTDQERKLVLAHSKERNRLQAIRTVIERETEASTAENREVDHELITLHTERATESAKTVEQLEEQIAPLREEREERATEVRQMLLTAGLKTAQDIIDAGCTGLFATFSSIEAVQRVQQNMGGSGVGLPCYIGHDRFCLVHQTIGGRQDGQKAAHPDYIAAVSRELTLDEKRHHKVVESARRQHGSDRIAQARQLLQEEEERKRKRAQGGSDTSVMEDVVAAEPQDMAEAFRCTEHGELFWGCRFCVAQAIVEGDLVPHFLVHCDDEITTNDWHDGNGVEERLEELNVSKATVYVRVATFTRRLARDR